MPYKERLKELYAELSTGPKGGPQWAEIARRLNDEGLFSPNGKPWKGNNLRQHWERMTKHETVADTPPIPPQEPQYTAHYTPEIPHQENQTDATQIPETEKRKSEACVPRDVLDTSQIPLTLSDEEISILKDIINERKARHTSPSLVSLPSRIPYIPPPKTKGTSLRLDQDLVNAATQKAKRLWSEDRVTLTWLLNWLLKWFSELETDPQPAPPAQDELFQRNEE